MLVLVCEVALIAHINAQPQPEKKTRLEGRVVGVNGEAVRKATVRLQASGQPAAPQASTRSFEDHRSEPLASSPFEDVPAGRYTLISEKVGFLTQRYGARSENGPGVPLNVVAGTETKGLDLRMTPQGVITGRVTDEDGDPIAGAQVSVARYGYSNGHRQLIQTGGALSAAASGAAMSPANALAILTGGGSAGTSDDQGNFRIVNLAPERRCYVSANPQGASALLNLVQAPGGGGGPSEPISITTYYPSSPDAQGAAPVDVAGGSEMSGINIRVRKQKVYSIRGKVTDGATGGAAAGATIFIFPLDGSAEANPLSMISNMSRIAPDGGFVLRNLMPGQYSIQGVIIPGLSELTAAAAGGAAPTPPRPLSLGDPLLTTRLEIGISNADVAGVVLQLSDGTPIPGTITVEDGKLADLLQGPQPSQGTVAPQGRQAAGARCIRLTMSDGPTVSSRTGTFAADGAFKITRRRAGQVFCQRHGIAAGDLCEVGKIRGARYHQDGPRYDFRRGRAAGSASVAQSRGLHGRRSQRQRRFTARRSRDAVAEKLQTAGNRTAGSRPPIPIRTGVSRLAGSHQASIMWRPGTIFRWRV